MTTYLRAFAGANKSVSTITAYWTALAQFARYLDFEGGRWGSNPAALLIRQQCSHGPPR